MARLLAMVLLVATPAIHAQHAQEIDFSTWRIAEEARFPAAEARQGVAADDRFLYVIGKRTVDKYDKHTRQLVAGWSAAPGGPIVHFNSGIVHDGRLILAHSNYPEVPMTSSVEWFDPDKMTPVATHSFGVYFGSVTWVLPYQDGWLVCFAHYGNRASEPNRDPTWTSLVRFDRQWRRTGGWVFPKALFARIGGAYTLSGGAFGPDGLLYVSGHDGRELHLLRFPQQGSEMVWLGSIPMPAEGQAFAWDPVIPDRFYGIVKRSREVVVGRLLRGIPATDPRAGASTGR